MNGIRLPFGRSGKGGAKGGGGAGGWTHRTVRLAASRCADMVQFPLPGLDDQTVLLGRGEIADIGPGVRPDAPVRLELLLTIRFQVPFGNVPQVVVLPETAVEGRQGPPPVWTEARAVGPEGFTLVLLPRPGSPGCRIGFHWVAIGSRRPPPLLPPDRPRMMPLPPETPPNPPAASRLWLSGMAACAALLPALSLRDLRPGARRGCGPHRSPGGAQ